jgi:fucose 4-O-acetylase-like acetyltransferase
MTVLARTAPSASAAPTTVLPAQARVAHVDVARGLSIVLVALYHSGLQPFMAEPMQAVGLCRLPLFFFLAGVVFPTGRTVGRVALERARALLLPYAVVLLALLARSAWKGEGAMAERLLGIAWGNGGTIEWIPMWFLPHLWLLSVVAALALRESGWLRWHPLAQGLALLALFEWGATHLAPAQAVALSWGSHTVTLPWWPFSADLIGVSLAFLLLGVRLREPVLRWRPQWQWVGAAAVVFLAVAAGSDARLNLNLRQCEAPLLAGAAALAGIYLLLALAWAMARVAPLGRAWRHLGQASLFILVFHDHVDNKVQALLAPHLGAGHPLLVALCAFGLCLAVPLLIRQAVLRQRLLALAFGLRPGFSAR